MRRSRWFILGVGVGAFGAKRVAMLATPVLRRPLEQSAERALRRMRADVRVAVREGVAAYRGDQRQGRILEGEVREFHGFK
ncbi:hypothetical protein [Ferrimicrobium acidiphilum]|jgi:hypothetical protein|uniref:Uncharacterized protein n=1 Tax=Ferrimicrobium acidiphilum DSM 19497 TaxID=1121877 RepID=A0A0D8FYV3_9ACTN|nr:hypothetical protein [Ferrimicrobium acidiphilum]KJE77922.1 hypothetical protein FEAC_02940 [Ferrimicrobium acidiphilum DSM 19497]MCL5053813.1 hypothetical protein [Gammaproteobacteria bacterium]